MSNFTPYIKTTIRYHFSSNRLAKTKMFAKILNVQRCKKTGTVENSMSTPGWSGSVVER